MRARRLERGALAVGGGLLVAAALPPWGFWPLAFCGLALFAAAVGGEGNWRQRLLRGWLFAAAWLLPGMAWMWFLTVPGYLVAVVSFAAFHGLAALIPNGRWQALARPAAHTLAEALRFCFPFGGVPLASLPIAEASGPFVGVARVGGAVLFTWFVFQLGFAATEVARLAQRRAGRRSRITPLAVGVGGALLLLVLSVVAPTGYTPGRVLRIAAVQGGGLQGTHAVDTDSRVVTERHLAATRTIPAGSVDLVLWPENVIDVLAFATSPEREEVAAEARRIGAPIAVGVTEDVPGDHFLNAQVVVAPDGTISGRSDKVRRVPFGEYMPLRGLLHALGAPTDLVPRNAVAGHGPAVVALPDGTRLGVVISWEVFFGGRANDGVEHGGQLIINPTNGSSYTWTVLQSQQIAASRLRATEQGRWVVQASPTGFSAFISPSADVYERTAVSERRVIIHDVRLSDGRTWYSRLGDKPFVALATVALLATVAAGRRRSDVDDHGDRAVVDQGDAHLGAEAAGGHGGAE